MLLVGDRIVKVAALKFPPLVADFLFFQFGFTATRTTNVLGIIPIGNSVALVLVTLVFTVFIIWACKNYSIIQLPNDPPFILIVFGGASNLFDRLTTGAVMDVFRIAVATHALVFNIADGMIVAGLFVMINTLRCQSSSRAGSRDLGRGVDTRSDR